VRCYGGYGGDEGRQAEVADEMTCWEVQWRDWRNQEVVLVLLLQERVRVGMRWRNWGEQQQEEGWWEESLSYADPY
jgi:hypothetical protein